MVARSQEPFALFQDGNRRPGGRRAWEILICHDCSYNTKISGRRHDVLRTTK